MVLCLQLLFGGVHTVAIFKPCWKDWTSFIVGQKTTNIASELKDDSDLGSIPVTVDVPSLPDFMVCEALKKGAKTARKFINMGIIETAYLSLQKQTLVVEKNNNEKSNERSNKS